MNACENPKLDLALPRLMLLNQRRSETAGFSRFFLKRVQCRPCASLFIISTLHCSILLVRNQSSFLRLFLISLFFIVGLLPTHSDAQQPTLTPAPIRFVLSFDDGPSAAVDANPTAHILDVLERNDIESGIKGIFFVQTRSQNGSALEIGKKLLAREFREGHLLAFHTATPRHANHRYLSPEELELTLETGTSDLASVTGKMPTLVRPPFWNYDSRTLMAYHQHGMRMLLTDLNANDGKIYGINFSLSKHRNMFTQLSQLRQHWLNGELPVVDGSTPIVVTFHDVNSYTASVLETYLQILLDVARELEIPTAPKAFYDDRNQLERAAFSRTVADINVKVHLPGFWNWLWQ